MSKFIDSSSSKLVIKILQNLLLYDLKNGLCKSLGQQYIDCLRPAEVSGSTNPSTWYSIQLFKLLKCNKKYNVPRSQPQPGGDKALVQCQWPLQFHSLKKQKKIKKFKFSNSIINSNRNKAYSKGNNCYYCRHFNTQVYFEVINLLLQNAVH